MAPAPLPPAIGVGSIYYFYAAWEGVVAPAAAWFGVLTLLGLKAGIWASR